MLARVDDPDRKGVSRRGLFGLGLSRAAEELPDMVPGVKRARRAADAFDRATRPVTWGDLRDAAPANAIDPLEGQLGVVGRTVVDAAAIGPDAEVLVIGASHSTVANHARERGATVTCVSDPEAIPHPEQSFDA